MGHPTPYPLCIFCGSKANSREHAIPKWVGKRLGLRLLEMNYVFALGLKHPRKQPLIFGSHRARIFCKECNAHFKHLEDEAADLVEWMARGRAVQLGRTEQDVLARWGAKTAYALAAADRDFVDLIPVEQRHTLRTEGRVHPLTWVGYASWEGRAHKSVRDDLGESRIDGSTFGAYSVVLTFAKLALKVWGVAEPVPRHTLMFDTDSLKQVWPRLDRAITWPLWPAAQDGNMPSLIGLPPLTPTA